MHPYTVYGIETTTKSCGAAMDIQDCMHPYTVYGIETCNALGSFIHAGVNCMHPYTVYGIETRLVGFISLTAFSLHAPLYRLRY